MSIEKRKRVRKKKVSNMPNVTQVANLAGVSTATVSRVLADAGGVSQELINRVNEAIKELDYRPNHLARGLRKLVSQTVGVIISDIENPFFTSVIRGIEKTFVEAGYSILLCNSDEDPNRERAQLSTLRSEGVAGIILTSTNLDIDFCRTLIKSGIQLVAIDRVPAQQCMDVVTVTNQQGAYEATSYLAKMGHSRIGLISGPIQVSTSRERLDGYKDAIRFYGLELSSELVVYSDFRQLGGYKAMQTLLDLPSPPTALMVSNNLMTLGALQAIHERNLKIPDQIAIIGFDDMPWSTSLQPPLTTVAQPTFDLGTTAARLLLDRFQNPKQPFRHVVLDTHLIIRASCGVLQQPVEKE